MIDPINRVVSFRYIDKNNITWLVEIANRGKVMEKRESNKDVSQKDSAYLSTKSAMLLNTERV